MQYQGEHDRIVITEHSELVGPTTCKELFLVGCATLVRNEWPLVVDGVRARITTADLPGRDPGTRVRRVEDVPQPRPLTEAERAELAESAA